MAKRTKAGKEGTLISITQWEKLLEKNTVELKLFEQEEDSPMIVIQKTLPLDKFWDAVDEFTEMCAPLINVGTDDAPDKQRIFMPESRDFALRRIVVSYYANFRLPKDYAQQYKLLYQTGVYDMIVPHINQHQLQEIAVSSDRKVEFKKDSMLSIASMLKGFSNKFGDILAQLGNVDADIVQQALDAVTPVQETGRDVMEQAIKEATANQEVANAEPESNIKIIK